jgi:hypothetical protein
MASKKEKPKSGDVLFVPLNKLKKSPKNVRKTPRMVAHSRAATDVIRPVSARSFRQVSYENR